MTVVKIAVVVDVLGFLRQAPVDIELLAAHPGLSSGHDADIPFNKQFFELFVLHFSAFSASSGQPQ
jgi:hypothetical protein